MNVDPMASQGYGWTTYRYGYDNPVNYTDPTGMLEDFVRTEEGNVQYDSRVTDQGTAEKYYGKNAEYKAAGYEFKASNTGDHIVLGEFGSYTRNGVGGGVAYDYADVPYTPSSANEGPLSGVGLGQFGNMGQSGQSVDWTDRGIKHHMYDAGKAVLGVGGVTLAAALSGGLLIEALPFLSSASSTVAKYSWEGLKFYHNTFGKTGGYANMAWNYGYQSFSTGNFSLGNKDLISLGISGFIRGNTPVWQQSAIGASSGLIQYTPNKGLQVLEGSAGYIAGTMVNGALSPILSNSRFGNAFSANFVFGTSQMGVNILENKDKWRE